MKQDEYVKKKNRKKNLIIVSGLIIFIILLGIIYLIIYNYDKVSYQDYDLYLYVGATRYDLSGTVTVSSRSGITNISSDKENVIITSNPIYFKDETNWAMIPEDMLFVDLKDSKNLYKLTHYTVIKSDGKAAKVSLKSDDVLVDPSILYDGNDLYLFPYDTTVTIDETTYNLKGLSYIIVNYHGAVEIFNKDNNEYTYIETHNKDVLADVSGFTINLDTDTVIDNKESRLLIKDIENVKEYTKEN